MSPYLARPSKAGYTTLSSTSSINMDDCPVDAPLRAAGLYRVHARTDDDEDERCDSLLARSKDDILREKHRNESPLSYTPDSLEIHRERLGAGREAPLRRDSLDIYRERLSGGEGKRRKSVLRSVARKGKKWVVSWALRGAWKEDWY